MTDQNVKKFSWCSGPTDEEHVALARDLTVFQDRRVSDIGCGEHHTVFVMQDGTVYSAGSNDRGQLGLDKETKTPGNTV